MLIIISIINSNNININNVNYNNNNYYYNFNKIINII